jgi:AcrR family transcriptional regulator
MSRKNSRERILEAALGLIAKRGEAGLTMAEIGKAARVSRQALYLNFANRGDLLVALVRYADENQGIEREVQKIAGAPTGLAALREMVSVQARMNPAIWGVARALDAVRRTDEAAERSWQDRLDFRLRGCRALASRLHREGTLRKDLEVKTAADILWSLSSLRMWEDLVLERGWTAKQYEERMYQVMVDAVTAR